MFRSETGDRDRVVQDEINNNIERAKEQSDVKIRLQNGKRC